MLQKLLHPGPQSGPGSQACSISFLDGPTRVPGMRPAPSTVKEGCLVWNAARACCRALHCRGKHLGAALCSSMLLPSLLCGQDAAQLGATLSTVQPGALTARVPCLRAPTPSQAAEERAVAGPAVPPRLCVPRRAAARRDWAAGRGGQGQAHHREHLPSGKGSVSVQCGRVALQLSNNTKCVAPCIAWRNRVIRVSCRLVPSVRMLHGCSLHGLLA